MDCNLCTSSLNDQEKYTCDECKTNFHQSCLPTWETHSVGKIIKIIKTKCPDCRKSLKILPIPDEEYRNPIDEVQTEEMCLRAVEGCGLLLQYVHNKTYEICLAAVAENGYAIQFVPQHLMSPELCLIAMTNYGPALQYVPEHLMTSELCLAAVTQNGDALYYVPEHLKTPDLCNAAVKQDGHVLQYVPNIDLKDFTTFYRSCD